MDETEKNIIEVQDLDFAYADQPDVPVLKGLNLSVREGECLAVLGESGSGKSTLLKLMCGLLTPAAGRILYKGRPLTGPGDEISMIFQNYGLFPWKSVRANIVLPLQLRGEKEDPDQVDRLLKYLGLTDCARRYPAELSGGQKQRAALGRAVLGRSRLILMDEPFSALDIRNREKLQRFMKDFFRDMKMTAVIVTHSIEEALVMGDRIAIFNPAEGRLGHIIENTDGGSLPADSMDYYRRIRDIRAALNEEGADAV